MKLLQLCAGQIRLNQPLPWNVRTEPGNLLLSKGQLITSERQLETLLERGMYVDEEEYERHRKQLEAAEAPVDPFYAWSEMVRKAAVILRDPLADPQFHAHVQGLAGQLHEAVQRDPDIGGFELAHMERVGYPVLHSLQTAYLCELVAGRLHLSAEEARSISCAALTMNVAMIDLQAQLCRQRNPLTEEQRAAVGSHAERSSALLRQAGVTDELWLGIVAQHHGQVPQGQAPVELAGVVQQADVYLAKLSPRSTRPALPVHEAARSFFLQNSGPGNPVAAAIIKEMGIYPPGAYVKLANGETAVVVRRGESANTPLVYSLANAQGIAFAEPVRRDTRMDRFKVLAPVARDNVLVRFDRARLFRSAA